MLATKIVSEDGISYNLTPLGYVVLIAVVIVMLAVGFIVKDKKTHSVKRLVTSAMAIALATLTSFITIFKMPMGGSVTLFSMLFIVLIGYWYGIRRIGKGCLQSHGRSRGYGCTSEAGR